MKKTHKRSVSGAELYKGGMGAQANKPIGEIYQLDFSALKHSANDKNKGSSGLLLPPAETFVNNSHGTLSLPSINNNGTKNINGAPAS